MSDVEIKLKGLEQIRRNFRNSPKVTVKWLNKAIRAGIFEIEKQATDANFRFRTPRSQRTGQLQRSFKTGIRFSNLRGSIGPTVNYAKFVHEGHSQEVGRYVPAIGKRLVKPFVRANRFMPRIAKAAEEGVQEQFEKAMEKAAREIANIR